MGVQHSKAGPASRQKNKAEKRGTAAAFSAIDARNVNKLRKALSVGAAIGNVRRSSSSAATDSTRQSRSMSLLEYAVDKNFFPGVDIMLKLTPPSELLCDADSVTAAFMRSCDNGYLRLSIFNAFVDAAIDGRIQLNLEAVYHQLVDHYLYRKPYDLVRRPCFNIAALNDAACRITPLGLAVIHGDVDAVESFVMRGADVNSYDRDGNTALLRAGFSLKRACLHKLLLLGADPNRRSCKRGSSGSMMSPMIAVCIAYACGNCNSARTPLIVELIACGADPSIDRLWFTSGSTVSSIGPRHGYFPPQGAYSRRLDEGLREKLAKLCLEPRSLQTLSACVVRKCLAAAEFNGVIKNTDRLPLPSTVKALLKLELFEIWS